MSSIRGLLIEDQRVEPDARNGLTRWETEMRSDLVSCARIARLSTLAPDLDQTLKAATTSASHLLRNLLQHYLYLTPDDVEHWGLRSSCIDPQRDADNQLPAEVMTAAVFRIEGAVHGPSFSLTGVMISEDGPGEPEVEARLHLRSVPVLDSFCEAVARFPDLVDEVCSYGGLRGQTDDPLVAAERAPSVYIESLRPAGDPLPGMERSTGCLDLVVPNARNLWATSLAAFGLMDFERDWRLRRPRPEMKLKAIRNLLRVRSLRVRPASTVTPLDFARRRPHGRPTS